MKMLGRINKVFVRFLFLSVLLLSFYSQFGQAGNFYLNLLKESKQEYLRKNYQKAIEHLKIAEFGLRENKIALKKIYFYYMASYFKLYQMNQVKDYFNSFKRIFNKTALDPKEYPADIYEDLIMVDILIRKDFNKILDLKSQIAYEKLFYKTIMNISKTDNDKLLLIHQQLKQIDKKDQRRAALSAVIDYRKSNYQRVIKQIQNVLLLPDLTLIEVKDKLYYYLALAYYNLKEYEKIPDIINKISSQMIIAELQVLININKVDKK